MIENKENSPIKRNKIDIAENELTEYWLKLETLISTISSRFLGNLLINDALEASLSDIGVLAEVSRSYIFQYSTCRSINKYSII